jgi:hypothetical protein
MLLTLQVMANLFPLTLLARDSILPELERSKLFPRLVRTLDAIVPTMYDCIIRVSPGITG